MARIEEIINIPILRQRFETAKSQGYLSAMLEEIVKQSKVEFNYTEEIAAEEDEDDESAAPS